MVGASSKKQRDSSSKFRGPVLFINHGIGNLNPSPHRHEVFTHVQNNYRKWRRLEDAKLIRAGVRLPTTTREQPQASSTQSWYASVGTKFEKIDEETKEAERQRELEEALRHSTSPLSLLKEGNSDPFSALKFKVDPLANNLIGFYRDYMIPAIYHTTSGQKALSNTSAQRDFNDVIDGMKDEGGAFGFLARNAFLAARSNPTMRKAAAIYGDKSVKLLMKKVAKGIELQKQTTYWHVNNLWAAETIDGNLSGALAHGKMLRFLFEQQSKAGKVDFKFLLYVIYTDCQMSATFLVRPAFDVERWLPQVLAPVSRMAAAAAAASLPAISEDAKYNDAALDDPVLREIFMDRRETMELWISSAKQEREVEHSQVILAWIAFRAVVSQGQTINYYLKKREELAQLKLTEEIEDRLYSQVYTALAALYLTRLWSFNNAVLGTPMYDAGPNILANLREILEKSDRFPGSSVFHQYNHARLWAFYVGAFGEQLAATTGKTKEDPCKLWFNKGLAEQAYVTGVKTWEEARDIFKGFLYTGILPPNGSTWFMKTLEAQGRFELD